MAKQRVSGCVVRIPIRARCCETLTSAALIEQSGLFTIAALWPGRFFTVLTYAIHCPSSAHGGGKGTALLFSCRYLRMCWIINQRNPKIYIWLIIDYPTYSSFSILIRIWIFEMRLPGWDYGNETSAQSFFYIIILYSSILLYIE